MQYEQKNKTAIAPRCPALMQVGLNLSIKGTLMLKSVKEKGFNLL